jgi:hypothetical protein
LKSSSNQSKKSVNHSIQLLILGGIHLRPVLGFALLAEDCTGELLEATVQRAELPEPLVADIIDGVKILRSGNFALEDQGMRMGDALRFQVELVGRLGRDLRQLRGEGGGHCERMNKFDSQARFLQPIALLLVCHGRLRAGWNRVELFSTSTADFFFFRQSTPAVY